MEHLIPCVILKLLKFLDIVANIKNMYHINIYKKNFRLKITCDTTTTTTTTAITTNNNNNSTIVLYFA